MKISKICLSLFICLTLLICFSSLVFAHEIDLSGLNIHEPFASAEHSTQVITDETGAVVMTLEQTIVIVDENNNVVKDFDFSSLAEFEQPIIQPFGVFPCCRYESLKQYGAYAHVPSGSICYYSYSTFYQCVNCGASSPFVTQSSGTHTAGNGQYNCPY